MGVAQEILQEVELSKDPITVGGGRYTIYTDQIYEEARVNEELGFIQVPEEIAFDHVTFASLAPSSRNFFIGFGVPTWQIGGTDLPKEWRPLTQLEELPKTMWSVDRQGKGVGPRLYNTPEAITGSEENWPLIGAYLFRVNPNLAKVITGQPDWLRIGQHAGKKAIALVGRNLGLKLVVNTVHSNYSRAQVVVHDQTVKGKSKEAERQHPGSPIAERLAIIRRHGIALTKVGTVDRSQAA